MNTASSYFPIVMQTLLAAGFVGFVVSVSHLIGPKRKSKVKEENFECGVVSDGDARVRFSIKYFMTAILFVLFDVEVIFFYPYAVNFKELGTDGFIAVLMFVSFFLVGFFYVLKKGALEWDK